MMTIKEAKQAIKDGKPVIGYKAFHADLTTGGKGGSHTAQFYDDGRMHSVDGEIEMCKNGFHFCLSPSGVWAYYGKGSIVYKIRAFGVVLSDEPGADAKSVCRSVQLIERVKVDGNYNTGDHNTGDYNTGDHNTGDYNTGDHNTGDYNTGNRNTGGSNTGNRNTGNFCSKTPIPVLFDLPCSQRSFDLSIDLQYELSSRLRTDELITCDEARQFLDIPNATVRKIRHLHRTMIAKRSQ